ncbi:MAG: ATP-binding cassette domain-containing protein, partial [Gammaproteobacteria bacterium]
MHAIEVKHLSKDFGILQAVTDVSFTVDRGDVLGFLGPNGAGKSTAMKMIAGFLEPSAGTVTVCGHDVVERPVAVKSMIGYLPEGAPLYGEMTPAGFLEFIAEVRGLSPRQREDR